MENISKEVESNDIKIDNEILDIIYERLKNILNNKEV